MHRRTMIAMASLGALAVSAPGAAAQTGGDGTVGGNVAPDSYELIISSPKSSLSTFSKARTYTTSFTVAVTTSETDANLSLADGDVASGTKRGRLASGSKLLPLPLEARVGKTAFAPLDLPVDTPLIRLGGPISNQRTTVNLRQEVEKKASGRYGKLLLVTLSSSTP
jgi:hypothetical protein